MAEVLELSVFNVHEAAPDDILSFDGRYVELSSNRSMPEGIECNGMSLYSIIDSFENVRLIKRGTK